LSEPRRNIGGLSNGSPVFQRKALHPAMRLVVIHLEKLAEAFSNGTSVALSHLS
jgi:hypothetical protein